MNKETRRILLSILLVLYVLIAQSVSIETILGDYIAVEDCKPNMLGNLVGVIATIMIWAIVISIWGYYSRDSKQ